MDKYKNKYRIASARLQHWDYQWAGAYFITVCTQNREHYFGHIVDGKMQLSQVGEIAQFEWLKTFEMRPDMNLWMGEYVVMPNHFHAIIGIGDNEFNRRRETQCRGAMHCVSRTDTTIHPKNQFGPQSKNLASIIRGYKIGVTKNARQINPDFRWQTRFYDHIIRDDQSFQKISEYIQNNPTNWQDDKFHNSEP